MATSPIHKSPHEFFQEEIEYFEENMDHLLKEHLGQYALIKGRTLVGTYSTSEEAYHQGIRAFKRQPFLIKHIVRKETPAQIPALFTGIIGADL